MATSPKKGIEYDRNVNVGVYVDAMGYPDTVRMDTNYRYHHQFSTDVDRLVQKIERVKGGDREPPL